MGDSRVRASWQSLAGDASFAFERGANGDARVEAELLRRGDSGRVVAEAEQPAVARDSARTEPRRDFGPARRVDLLVRSYVAEKGHVLRRELHHANVRETLRAGAWLTTRPGLALRRLRGALPVLSRRLTEVAAKSAGEDLVGLKSDGERDVQHGVGLEPEAERGPLEPEPLHVFLRRLAERLLKQPMKMPRRAAGVRGKGLQRQVSVEMGLYVHENGEEAFRLLW